MKIEFDNKNKYNFTGNVLSCICFIFNVFDGFLS